jgi:site-specific DNA recombinase
VSVNNGSALRVALYIRVSTDEQAERGYSVPEQRRVVSAYAEERGWRVVALEVDDGYSGKVGVRPGLDRLTALAEAGEVDVILARWRNRFFRDRYLRLGYERQMKEYGVQLVALNDTGNRLGDAMTDEFDDWYREEVRKNTINGRMEKARQGKLIRCHTPVYGFEYTPDGCGYVVVPERMAVARRVIESVARGETIHSIKRDLERDGVPTPSSVARHANPKPGSSLTYWNGATIRDMVREDAYRPVPYAELAPMLTPEALSRLEPGGEYGIVWYPRRRVKQLDPDPERGYKRPQTVEWRPEEERVPVPVVSSGIPKDVVDAARERLNANRPHRKQHSREYELSGIIRCALCGCLMGAARNVNRYRTNYYYRCTTNQRDGKGRCPNNKSLVAGDTERLVLEAVLDAVKDRDALEEKADADYERERKRLERLGADAGGLRAKLEALKEQTARAQRAYMEGVISLEDVRDRTAEVEAERRHVQRLLEEYEDRAARLSELAETHRRTVELIRSGSWEELGITRPEARRERYREIGLDARADETGTITLSWGFGEGNAASVRTKETSSRPRADVPSSAQSSSGSSTPRRRGRGGGFRGVARTSRAC